MNRVFVPLQLPPAPMPALSAQVRHLHGLTMGTTWSVKLVLPLQYADEDLRRGIQSTLDEIVAQMSTWESHSDLSRFNMAPAQSWHALPENFYAVLACALDVARESGGAYDPSIGPLVNLWGFGPHEKPPLPPTPDEVKAQQIRCGWQRVQLDAGRRSAYQAGDTYIDLSAIAKGFGVDRVVRYLKSIGTEAYLVEVGGELSGFGLKPDGDPWWVELEQPPGYTADARKNIVALHGLSVATSGDYRRYFESGGRRYSHTIDPRSGCPAAHNLASVTVIHAQCMVADAWSTALGVMGSNEGLVYARKHAIAARFVDRYENGFREKLSPALAAMLE